MSDFVEEKTNYRGPEIDEADSSGYLMGVIGALIGAIVGAIPWFLVANFMNMYVGWLGFLIGWASLFGYKMLHGVKKTGYATAVIFICSLVCIILATFGIYVYSLFKEPEIVEYARALGLSKIRFTFELLKMPEVLPDVIKDFAIALVIGVIGVISTKGQINVYTGKVPAKGKKAEQTVTDGEE